MKEPAIRSKWEKLLLVNYPVDKKILEPYLPLHTELAIWKQQCYVSLVGFLFLDVKVKGISIPFHTNFCEINLRMYVRRKFENDWRYGVVFIREVVALPMVTFVANTFFHEPYHTAPMKYEINTHSDSITAKYSWKEKNWNSFQITADPIPVEMIPGSEEEFMTTQHWGFTKAGTHKTLEYRVEHPPWRVYPTKSYQIDMDFAAVYGPQFAFLRDATPTSAFLAEGSPITLTPAGAIR